MRRAGCCNRCDGARKAKARRSVLRCSPMRFPGAIEAEGSGKTGRPGWADSPKGMRPVQPTHTQEDRDSCHCGISTHCTTELHEPQC
jgi:hypothetical protein